MFMNKVINAECVSTMQKMKENIVDTIITDPPYGLSFMGKEWDSFTDNTAFQEWTRRWAVEAFRVAKPGATMLCFGGTRTYHRIACGLEDAGWEIKDTIMWVYGSGFPKSYNISKGMDKKAGAEREVVGKSNINIYKENKNHKFYSEDEGNPEYTKGDITAPATDEAKLWDGWGTALKPAYEPIIVATKPREGTYVNNALKYGVAGLNIDGSKVGIEVLPEQKAGQATIGTFERENMITPERIGRFPANFIHDGIEAEWSRYFYCAKVSKKERNAGLEGMEDHQIHTFATANGTSGKPSSISEGRNTVYKNNHPTVKPLSLMIYLAKLTKTPTGGIVLDPFMGSGTTGMACKKVGRPFLGIELDEHYCEIAEKRIENIQLENLS